MHATDPIAEGQRIFTICNACRYCEGYCAVFPAMERRLTFARGDIDYLANLCHDCGECYSACQYAPPHEFAVNVPQTLAAVRSGTWRRYAWPQSFAKLYEHSGVAASLLVAACFVVLLAIAVGPSAWRVSWRSSAPAADFYAVIPHATMAWVFGIAALYVMFALTIGFRNFSRDVDEPTSRFLSLSALGEGMADAFSLRYLHGGGAGCAHPDERSARLRRIFHHLTFYGFLLCFAATATGTIYHYALGQIAPYGYLSLPVVLGTVGGVGLVVGPLGFLWLRRSVDPATISADQQQLNFGLNLMLILTSGTGLLLLALRDTVAMGALLVLHLAVVLALFVTLPYGKFVHGFYRLAALMRYAVERRRPKAHVAGE